MELSCSRLQRIAKLKMWFSKHAKTTSLKGVNFGTWKPNQSFLVLFNCMMGRGYSGLPFHMMVLNCPRNWGSSQLDTTGCNDHVNLRCTRLRIGRKIWNLGLFLGKTNIESQWSILIVGGVKDIGLCRLCHICSGLKSITDLLKH